MSSNHHFHVMIITTDELYLVMPVCLSLLVVLFWSSLTLAWLQPYHSFLKSIQYCGALIILKRCETDHIAFLFQSLHWLPITQRIKYKINTLCYKCIKRTALSYICDCPQLYALLCLISVTVLSSTHCSVLYLWLSSALRTALSYICDCPQLYTLLCLISVTVLSSTHCSVLYLWLSSALRTALSYICDCPQLYALLCRISVTVLSSTHRLILSALFLILSASRFLVPDFPLLAFSIFGPCTWNDLPLPLQKKPSLASFKSKFKTFFSKRAALPCFPRCAAIFLCRKSLFIFCFLSGCNLCRVCGVATCLCRIQCGYALGIVFPDKIGAIEIYYCKLKVCKFSQAKRGTGSC